MVKRYGFVIFQCLLYLVLLFAYSEVGHAKINLRAQEPDLCYSCHKGLKNELAGTSVHSPFREGNCSVCHNVHASKHRGLVREDINELCYKCHADLEKRIKETKMHGAIRDGKCTDCHNAHSSKNRFLLVNAEKEICFNCHKDLRGQINKITIHSPFNNGECSACHNAHASREDNLLSAPSNQVCQKCHAPRCNVDGVSITNSTSKMECVSCHTGHNSNTKGLLGPYGHPDFLDEKCMSCHKPFQKGKAIETVMEGKELCFKCHVKDPARFHDDDIHATFQENSCVMCHNYHASNKPNMTVNESSVCLQCHGDIDMRIARMTKRLKGIRCAPVKSRRCFECHVPMHSLRPWYFKEDADVIKTCVRCHKKQHRVTHPLGDGVIDPRNGEVITCKTCHSMHDAQAQFMLRFDRERELCIQCHKM